MTLFMLVLSTVVFMMALWLSITWLMSVLNSVYSKIEQDNFDLFIFVLAVLLWGTLYFLSHYPLVP